MAHMDLKKVLIVDDEKELASVISAYLTLKGYATTISLEGRDAFQKARNAQYDIIVTDFRMPKLNGAELITSIRNSGFNTETPIILSSGYQAEALQELKGLDLTNVKMLPKPFKMENLLNVVKEFENRAPKENAAPKLNAELMNLIISATTEVLTELAEVKDIKASAPQLLQKNNNIKVDITGILAVVSSEFQGSMSLSFKSDSYLKIINCILKEKYQAISGENEAEISQILNFISGKIRSALQQKKIEMKKTNPAAFSGANHDLPDSGNARTLMLSFDSSVGTFWITIAAIQNAA